jgi:hypothetical protein
MAELHGQTPQTCELATVDQRWWEYTDTRH